MVNHPYDNSAKQQESPTGEIGRDVKRARHPVVILLVLLVAFVIALTIGYLGCVRRGPTADLSVDAPNQVQVGETFQVSVVVKNKSSVETVVLTGVEVDHSYAGGLPFLSVISSNPPWTSVDPVSGSSLFKYDNVTIAPLAEKRVTFTLRADKEGLFEGWIAVFKPGRYVNSAFARSQVRTRATTGNAHPSRTE